MKCRNGYIMHGSRRGDRGPDPPGKSQHYRVFLAILVRIPRIITKPPFNVRPSSARQRNTISMVFCWWANDGLLLVLFGSFPLPLSFGKKIVRVGLPRTKGSGSVHDLLYTLKLFSLVKKFIGELIRICRIYP